MSKRMFAGASTPVGFVDLFDNILPTSEAQVRLFLKGSSGSGKSTFMKKVAAEFETLGYEVERFHCANDAESLDSIAVSAVGLCIMDATFPHAHDPQITIAIDKMPDFARFIDEQKLEPYLDELKSLAIAKKVSSKYVDMCLAAIGSFYGLENRDFEGVLDAHAVQMLAKKYIDDLSIYIESGAIGHERKLFLSAITPDGYVSFADSHFKGCKVYGVSCDMIGVGKSIFLEELKNLAISYGVNVTSFYNPFSPEQIEHLYFPEASVAFASVGSFASGLSASGLSAGRLSAGRRFGYGGKVDVEVDINACVRKEAVGFISKLSVDCDLFDKMFDNAVNAMYNARLLHIRTEEIYASTMNFDGLNAFCEMLIEGLREKVTRLTY